jgi:hypothetical protein
MTGRYSEQLEIGDRGLVVNNKRSYSEQLEANGRWLVGIVTVKGRGQRPGREY